MKTDLELVFYLGKQLLKLKDSKKKSTRQKQPTIVPILQLQWEMQENQNYLAPVTRKHTVKSKCLFVFWEKIGNNLYLRRKLKFISNYAKLSIT